MILGKFEHAVRDDGRQHCAGRVVKNCVGDVQARFVTRQQFGHRLHIRPLLGIGNGDQLHAMCAQQRLEVEVSRIVNQYRVAWLQPKAANQVDGLCAGVGQNDLARRRRDAASSMFGLMFFPDRSKGFAEIYRTLKPDGSIAVTSWAPLDQSPAMQMMFGALKTIKPDLPEPQRAVASLENPDVFKQELLDAGFREVKIQRITKAAFPVESIPAFWDDMVKGSAPIQMLKKSMGETAWLEQEILAIKYLEENLPSVPTTLSSDAWLGLGIK